MARPKKQDAAHTTDQLTTAELTLLRSLHSDALQAKVLFDKFTAQLSATYGFGPQDTLDIATGVVTRHVEGD